MAFAKAFDQPVMAWSHRSLPETSQASGSGTLRSSVSA
jgi:hypothetical protein